MDGFVGIVVVEGGDSVEYFFVGFLVGFDVCCDYVVEDFMDGLDLFVGGGVRYCVENFFEDDGEGGGVWVDGLFVYGGENVGDVVVRVVVEGFVEEDVVGDDVGVDLFGVGLLEDFMGGFFVELEEFFECGVDDFNGGFDSFVFLFSSYGGFLEVYYVVEGFNCLLGFVGCNVCGNVFGLDE